MSGNPTLRHLKGVRVKVGADGLDIDLGDIPAVISPMANIPLSAAEKISIRDSRQAAAGGAGFFRRIPLNLLEVEEDVCYFWRFPPTELDALTVPELLRWHSAIPRIQKLISGPD